MFPIAQAQGYTKEFFSRASFSGPESQAPADPAVGPGIHPCLRERPSWQTETNLAEERVKVRAAHFTARTRPEGENKGEHNNTQGVFLAYQVPGSPNVRGRLSY